MNLHRQKLLWTKLKRHRGFLNSYTKRMDMVKVRRAEKQLKKELYRMIRVKAGHR